MLHLPLFLLASLWDAQEPPDKKLQEVPVSIWQVLQEKYDANEDGRISKAEHGRGEEAFRNLDRNGDGFLTEADTQVAPARRRGRRSPQENGVVKNEKPPVVGEVAPDFELRVLVPEMERPAEQGNKVKGSERTPSQGATLEGPKEEAPATVKLSSFSGKKPVALIFGSYT